LTLTRQPNGLGKKSGLKVKISSFASWSYPLLTTTRTLVLW
jgi:hypothetical protein